MLIQLKNGRFNSMNFLRKAGSVLLLLSLILYSPLAQIFDGQARAAIETGTLDNFITRSGDKLFDGTEEFKFITTNIPELAYNENPYWQIPDPWEQEDAIRSIAQIGGLVTRTYTISVKKASEHPNIKKHVIAPGQFDEDMFVALDKTLQLANEYGIRVIIPLVDQWEWWGGIKQYAEFRGKNESDFWTDPQLISDFKQTIHYVLNRTNTFTGVQYKDDKAILAWETGNELSSPDAWAQDISAYIKSIDDNHLTMDGNFTAKHGFSDVILSDPNIDIVTNHYYEMDGRDYAARITSDRNATAGKKPLILGEFGLTSTENMKNVLNAVIANGTSGAMLWSIRQHSKDGGFFVHGESDGYYAYHWPGFPAGDSYDETNVLQLLRQKAFEIRGLPVPILEAPVAPILLPIDAVSHINWRGSTGASSYVIERADQLNGPWSVVGQNVYDSVLLGKALFHDTSAATGNTYFYRVKAVNNTAESPYSNVVGPVVAKHLVEDDLLSLYNIYTHTPNVRIVKDHPDDYAGDFSKLKRKNETATNENIVYAAPKDLKSMKVEAYFAASTTEQFKFYSSEDYEQFTEFTPAFTDLGGDIHKIVYEDTDLPARTKFIKIEFPQNTGELPQIGKVVMEYAHDGGPLNLNIPAPTSGLLTDHMEDFNQAHSRSPNLYFSRGNSQSLGGDDSLLTRRTDTAEYIVYKTAGNINSFTVETYIWPGETAPAMDYKFYGSTDDITYSELSPIKKNRGGDWIKVDYEAYTVPENITYLKVEFPLTTENSAWNPQISRIQIGYGNTHIPAPASNSNDIIDTYDDYGGADHLMQSIYKVNPSGDPVTLSLDSTNKNEGSHGLKFDYVVGTNGYAGVEKSLDHLNWSSYDTLQFWLKADDSGRSLDVSFQTENGDFWENKLSLTNTNAGIVQIPLKSFSHPSWFTDGSGQMDLSSVKTINFTVGGLPLGSGTIYLDSIRVVQSPFIIDDLADFTNLFAKSDNIGIDTSNIESTGDGDRFWRTTESPNEWVTYQLNGKRHAQLSAGYWEGEPISHFKFYTSSDNDNWSEFTPNITTQLSSGEGLWHNVIYDLYDLSSAAKYLKIEWGNLEGQFWSPQLKKVALDNKAPFIDDFENYGGIDTELRAAYTRNMSGNDVTISLDSENKYEGSYGMKYEYSLGNGTYAGMVKTLDGVSWVGNNALRLWLKPDASNNNLTLQFKETNGEYWETSYELTGTEPSLVVIPFTSFAHPQWFTGGNGIIDLDSIADFSIYVSTSGEQPGVSTFYVDAIEAVKVEQSSVYTYSSVAPEQPDGQNGWYVHPVTVSLDSVDAPNGVAKTEYRINMGAWQQYTGAIPSFGDGVYTFDYRSTDNIGSVEAVKTLNFKVSTTPPGKPENVIATPGIGQVTLSWTDPGDSEFNQVHITGAGQPIAVAKGVQNATLVGLSPGTHYSVQLTTSNEAGNVSDGVTVSVILAPTTPTTPTVTIPTETSNQPVTPEPNNQPIKVIQKLSFAALSSKEEPPIQLEIRSSIASLILQSNMLLNDDLQVGEIEVHISQLNASGTHPVIELSVQAGDRAITWNHPQIPIVVSIPYKPTEEELKNLEHIVIRYMDANGKVQAVPSGRYDPRSGAVTFTTTQFGRFAISFVQKTFNDIDSFAWAKKQIEVLASKGIVNGITDTKFNPRDPVTRADFIVLLVRTLELQGTLSDSFADVPDDAYYSTSLRIARELGIASGSGDNKFKPQASITREEMMVLTYRALLVAKKQLSTDVPGAILSDFSDSMVISAYALESVAALVKMGLIHGSDNAIQPKKTSNRAQTAVLMYNIYLLLEQ
jgi:hypothetical protein